MKNVRIIEFLFGLVVGLVFLAFFEFIEFVEGDDPPATRGAHAAVQVALLGLIAGTLLVHDRQRPATNQIWRLSWASALGFATGGTALGTAFFQTEWFHWPGLVVLAWLVNPATSLALCGAAFCVGWLWQRYFPESANNVD